MIPFYDIKRVLAPYQVELKEAAATVIDSGQYILGPQLNQFEQHFASYCKVSHCVGVGNGYDALDLVLKAWLAMGKIKMGDEVILPSNTFVATALAVKQNQLKPVFVAANPFTYLMEVEVVVSCITERSRVIIPVHLYGQMVDMEAMEQLATKYQLLILEDAAQAHGASQKGKGPGNLGHAAAFSFYPVKNLGALGDAGAVITNDEPLATMVRKIANYGSDKKYVHEVLGVNSRLDEIQAAFLNVRLNYLERELSQRKQIAERYLMEIKLNGIQLPQIMEHSVHAWHLFVIQIAGRDAFLKYLGEKGIATLIHYPVDLRENTLFGEVAPPMTSINDTLLSIPLFPGMLAVEVDQVIEAINNY